MAIIGIGEKLHIIERRLFLGDVRRHFVGEVLNCIDNIVREDLHRLEVSEFAQKL